MTTFRITQSMLTERSHSAVQSGLGRMAAVQEKLSTGRQINRPSDNPADTATALRLRRTASELDQYTANAQDGQDWTAQVDTTVQSMLDVARRVRDLGLQGANSGASSASARQAIATELDQLRDGLLASANTSYDGRPLFGGITSGASAYASDGTWTGVAQPIERVVGAGVRVRIDLNGPEAFGPDGDNLFDHVAALRTAVASGDSAATQTALSDLSSDLQRLTDAAATNGTRAARLERAVTDRKADALSVQSSLSTIENTDLASATIDLQMSKTAYEAALASTARIVQPSLLDFLR